VALLVPGLEVGTVQIEPNFKGMPSDESPLVPDRWTVHLMAVAATIEITYAFHWRLFVG
jgi:hypothetical protein